ncbi:myrosinase 1-like [Neodiprion pinetum]|uniref:myrosinase 1-like n=1 Tax=Neodiprion pinetum TaxID=441929 RepID=UPI001EDEB5BA|nr:myrosinase 1-like [Neodiprion pinetum]
MTSTLCWSLLLYFLLISRIFCHDDDYLTFPEGFRIGAAGASYQIEGGWNASDKGHSVWDNFTHREPWRIVDNSNGDIACDSYHKYKEDVKWLKEIGLDHYRFSLSWSRILPTGYADKVSEDGIRYYKNLIDELLRNSIEPLVTLYHWDHPQVIEEQGGWMNDMIVKWFGDYARVVFRELGPKVKIFATINEPNSFCTEGYEDGCKAPGKQLAPTGGYMCGHNVLKAHARAYHIYDREFRKSQNGKIGIVIPCGGQIAKNPGDNASVETSFQFGCGWMAHPIFSKTGDYPEVMKRNIDRNSKNEGYPRSRLPKFSPNWIKYIRGTSDYFGLNHYTTFEVSPRTKKPDDVWALDSGLEKSVDPSWPRTASAWLRVTPFGFGDILRQIKDEYENPPVYILENGVSDSGTLTDHQRIGYFYSYLKELITAVKQDGCNVPLYTMWSLLDNFEWNRGYTERFGILHVDFNSSNRTRTPKLSVDWWKNVLRTRKLQPVTEYW